MKRFLITLVCLLSAALAFAGGAKEEESAVMKYSFDVLASGVQEEAGYYIPFVENGAELAKQNHEMRVYFFSGEKKVMDPGGEFADRWGDGAVIFFPNGETMLIDAARPPYANQLVENLKRLGVSTIDYYIQSHLHSDHYGCLPEVLTNFTIKKAYWNGCSSSESVRAKVLGYFEAMDVPYEVLQRGDAFDVGECHIDIFNPNPNVVGNMNLGSADETTNNTSIGMVIAYKNFKVLFSGDMYIAAEEDVISAYKDDASIFQGITLLKTNHHGRTTSNSKNWAELTQPVIAVTTRGEGCDTGVYQNYARYGAHVFGDFTDGYVRVVSDGAKYTNTTCSRERETKGYASYDKIAQTMKPELWAVE